MRVLIVANNDLEVDSSARIMERFELVRIDEKTDAVLVQPLFV